MKLRLRMFLITILISQCYIVNSQKYFFNKLGSNIYYEALKIHITNIINDSSLMQSVRGKTHFYIYNNCTIEKKSFDSIKINGIKITLDIIDNSEISNLMRSMNMHIIYINPIKFDDYLYVDIIDFGIQPIKGKKKFNFIDSGGTRLRIEYDCIRQEYFLEILSYE